MRPSHHGHARGWCAAALLALAVPAWAAGPAADKASIESSYQRERAACQAMSDPAARTNCLRDTGAAHAQARKTGQRTTSEEELMRNALARCKVHPPSEQARCESMARGGGSASGSVQGGGVLRELVTQEPVVVPASPPVQPVSPPVQRMAPPVEPLSPPVQPLSPPVIPPRAPGG